MGEGVNGGIWLTDLSSTDAKESPNLSNEREYYEFTPQISLYFTFLQFLAASFPFTFQSTLDI